MFGRIRILLYTLLLSLLAGSWYFGYNLQLLPPLNASNQNNHCQSKPLLKTHIDPQQGLDPQAIRFLNWNIYKQNRAALIEDLNRYAKTHDILTLQEARLDRGLLELLKQHQLNWTINSAFYWHGDATGVMTVADQSALDSCGFLVNEPLIYLPKAALIMLYPIKGRDDQSLLVANLHGINFSFGLEAYRQQLDKLYRVVKDHQGPMIVAGDFNSWSDARMAQVMAMVNKLSLSKLDYRVNNKTHIFGNAIDHVFYRQLEPLSKQVQQVSSSDHNPISVNFRVL